MGSQGSGPTSIVRRRTGLNNVCELHYVTIITMIPGNWCIVVLHIANLKKYLFMTASDTCDVLRTV